MKKTKKSKLILVTMMVLAMVFAIVGCGGKPSLSDWYSKNSSQFASALESANKQSATLGVTMDITVEDSNVLVYRYTLAEKFDNSDQANVDALTSTYDTIFESYKSNFSSVRKQLMDETSTKDIIIRLEVLNPDKTKLYSKDYTE